MHPNGIKLRGWRCIKATGVEQSCQSWQHIHSFLVQSNSMQVVTARKRSLGQGNMFTGVCLSTEGVLCQHALQVLCQHALQQLSRRVVLSKHALQVVSQHALQQVYGGGLQAHTQGGSGGGSGPGPQLGAVEGDLLGGGGAWSWGVPALGGDACSGDAWSQGVPALGGLVLGGCLVPGWGVPGRDPPDSHCCRQYASYWNAFLLVLISVQTMISTVNQSVWKLKNKREVGLKCINTSS